MKVLPGPACWVGAAGLEVEDEGGPSGSAFGPVTRKFVCGKDLAW